MEILNLQGAMLACADVPITDMRFGFERMWHLKCKLAMCKAVWNKHCPLIGILFGSALVSISFGPYHNWDSLTEYAAASGVIKWGLPYISLGNLINEPPLGYYIDAFFFKTFGLSYETGVNVITLFGLGCVFLVYEIGKALYGTRTGLLAAALFGLSPWHVVMSRVFLIDVQCLFFSLLYLLIGIWAIHKESLKLLFVSGILFGFALLTKAFAVFMLIPLSIFYIHERPKDLKQTLGGISLFFLPAFLLNYLWYELISGRGLLFVFHHDDFVQHIPNGIVPSYFFSISYFLWNPGMLLLIGGLLSLLLSFFQRKFFAKVFISDLVCFVTIIGVAGLNMYLVIAQNLWIPYVALAKYDYQVLPFFCLLAASLASKCSLSSGWGKIRGKHQKLILYAVIIGLGLVAASIIVDMKILNMYIDEEYLLFRVEGEVSYSFVNSSPIITNNYLVSIQILGFVSIMCSLLGSMDLFKKLRRKKMSGSPALKVLY